MRGTWEKGGVWNPCRSYRRHCTGVSAQRPFPGKRGGLVPHSLPGPPRPPVTLLVPRGWAAPGRRLCGRLTCPTALQPCTLGQVGDQTRGRPPPGCGQPRGGGGGGLLTQPQPVRREAGCLPRMEAPAPPPSAHLPVKGSSAQVPPLHFRVWPKVCQQPASPFLNFAYVVLTAASNNRFFVLT